MLFILFQLVRSQDVKVEALFLLILFVSILIHEFGHSIAARHFGSGGDKILLWPFGGLAFVGSGRSSWGDFWITFFGPFVHIPLALIAVAWLHWHGASFQLVPHLYAPVALNYAPPDWWGIFFVLMFQVQVMAFCFNVFTPAYPMDGGRMLVSLLLPRLGADRTCLVALVLSAVCGVYMMVENQSFIAILVIMEAANLYQLRQSGRIYDHPSFSYTSKPLYSQSPSRTRAKTSRDVSHLRLVVGGTKQCPQCGRSLPESAKMCGFCEIVV